MPGNEYLRFDPCRFKYFQHKEKKVSGENKSIHEFDFTLICEYFSSIERQGPGSPEATIKALSFIGNLTNESKEFYGYVFYIGKKI